MGLRLRHKSLFLTYVLAPLCAISNFNYEQVNPRNFPAAMLLHGRLSQLEGAVGDETVTLARQQSTDIFFLVR